MKGNQGSNGVPAAQNDGESAAEDGFDGFSPRKPVKTVIVGSTGRMGAMLLGRARAAGLTVEGVDVPLTPEILAPACAGEQDVWGKGQLCRVQQAANPSPAATRAYTPKSRALSPDGRGMGGAPDCSALAARLSPRPLLPRGARRYAGGILEKTVHLGAGAIDGDLSC